MPRIPLADLPSQNISGARMPYADANAMTAPAQAIVNMGETLQTVAEKWKADQDRMMEFNARIGLEKLNTDMALNAETDLANSAPDGSNFPAMRAKALSDGYAKLRATIQDPVMAKEADLIFERMRGDVLVKSVVAADTKRENYVTTETNNGVSNAIQLGQIKTRADAENYFTSVIKPKIDLAFVDPAKREKLYGIFGNRLLDELQIIDPGSLLPKPITNGSAPDKAAALLRNFEGLKTQAYWDINAHRVGYGSDTTTLADGSVARVTPNTTVTPADAERDLSRRIVEFGAAAEKQVGPQWGKLNADQQAALISVAYNYGSLPVSVVNAVRSGDVNAIAQSVANLKINPQRRVGEAAVIAGKTVIPTGTESRFAGGMWDYVKPDTIRTAQNSASNVVRDQLSLGIENQTVARSEIENAPIQDGDKATLLSRWDTKNKDMLDVADIQQRLATSPESIGPDDAKAADNWYKMAVGGDPSALSSNDPQVSANAASVMTGFFSKVGFLPKSARLSLEGMVRSSDPQKVASAMTLMDALERTNQFAFNKDVPENMRKMLDVWQTQRGYMTDAEIVKTFTDYNDPAQAKVIEQRGKNAEAYVIKNYDTIEKKLNVLDGGMFDWQASPPVDSRSADSFGIEFNDVFIQAYKETGDPEKAISMTQQRIGRIWGKSNFAGSSGALMRRPPEYSYPAVDGSHDWMHDAISKELLTLGYDVGGKQWHGPKGSGGSIAPEWSYRLLSTPETEADITGGSRSKYPRYQILLQNNVTGQPDVLDHYYFDPTPYQNAARQKFNAAQARVGEIANVMSNATGPAGFDINKVGGNPFEGK